jgi:hypothetical protein
MTGFDDRRPRGGRGAAIRAGLLALAAGLAIGAVPASAEAAKPFRLRTFAGCEPFVDYARAQAQRPV